MDRVPNIRKEAFIARVNDREGRRVVDTCWEMVEGEQKLILLLDNGEREIFKGLRAA